MHLAMCPARKDASWTMELLVLWTELDDTRIASEFVDLSHWTHRVRRIHTSALSRI